MTTINEASSMTEEDLKKQIEVLNAHALKEIASGMKERKARQLAAEDDETDEDEEDESPLGSNLKFPLSKEDARGFLFLLRRGMRRVADFLEPLTMISLSQNGPAAFISPAEAKKQYTPKYWTPVKEKPNQFSGIAIRKDGDNYIITCPIGHFRMNKTQLAHTLTPKAEFEAWLRSQITRKGNRYVIEIPASKIESMREFSTKKLSAKAKFPGHLMSALVNITLVDDLKSAVIDEYKLVLGEDGVSVPTKVSVEKPMDQGGSSFYDAPDRLSGIAVAEFRVSKSQMQYMTQEEEPGMNYAVDLIASHYEQSFLRGPKAARMCIPISQIAESVAEKNAAAAKDFFATKLNSDRIGYHSDGSIYRIEPMLANITTDNVAMYEQMLTSLVKTERDENTFAVNDLYGSNYDDPLRLQSKMETENPIYKMGQSIIYADFVNKKISYTTSDGGLTVFDLDEFSPANAGHYLKGVLEVPLVVDGKEVEGSNDQMVNAQYINWVLRESNLSKLSSLLPEELQELDLISGGKGQAVYNEIFAARLLGQNIANILRMYSSYTYRTYTAKNIDVPSNLAWVEETHVIKLKDLNPDSDISFLRPLGRLLVAYAEKSVFQSGNTPELEFLRAKRSPVSAMSIEAVLYVVAKFSQPDRLKGLQVEDADVKAKYRAKANLAEISIQSIPFVKKDRMMLFHQTRVFAEIMESPINTVLSVQAGGGKTALAVFRSCIEMKRGNVPILISCPSHLVKDYIKEFNYFTAGRVNTVVVTNGSFRNFGADKIELLIKNLPINSVIITDYDFIKGKTKHVGYGTKSIPISPNAEFLRKFGFKLMIADESHYLKNASGRSASVKRLIRDIPMKQLMSGTFIADTLVDVPAQFGLMDQSAFGSRTAFIDEFALESVGGRVISWKPTAFQDIKKRMAEHCKLVQVDRKEWSAFLPPKTVDFHNVQLTYKQLELYNMLLSEKLEELEQRIAADPQFKEIWDALQSGDESSEMDDAIESFVGPILQDIERFLSAPMDSKFGPLLVNPSDQISPKALKAYEICEKHLADGLPGKILIFCKYHSTVNAIYNNMPPALKAKTIHYTAGKKIQCTLDFEKNDQKQIMIGIEDSMNTGLNLQFASRLIRIELPWSPSALEQGESRINRPNIKAGKDVRPRIYFDWILAENTYDILKSTRVLSKVCTVSKFNNAEDERYDSLLVPPAIPIRISTLRGISDFEVLKPYFESYLSVLILDKESAEEWRAKNADAKPLVLGEGEVLPASKILRQIPFVPGMDIFGADELGLERASDFITEEGADKVEGKYIHTEDGDGVCEGLTPNGMLKVRINGGRLVSYNPLSVFVINKKVTNTMEIRKNYVRIVGLKSAGDLFEQEQPIEEEKPSKMRKPLPNEDEEEDNGINLFALSVNDIFALGVDSADPDVSASKLAKFGFKEVPTYYAAPITTAKQLQTLAEVLTNNPTKFVISSYGLRRLKALWAAMKAGGKDILRHPNVQEVEIKNFFRTKFKPLSNPKEVRPYPMVSNGKLFIALDPLSSPATRKLIAQPIPGVRFAKSEGELYSFYATKADLLAGVKEVQTKSGVVIDNLDALQSQLNTLKVGGKKLK